MGNRSSTDYGKHVDEKEEVILSGPVKNRGCTDIICCLVFVTYMIGMIIIAVIGVRQGSPKRLLSPTDSNGKLCGSDIPDKPFLHFFDLSKCFTKGAKNPFAFVKKTFRCPTPQVCVSKCNERNARGYEIPYKDMICVEGTNVHENISESVKRGLVTAEKCAPYYLESKEIFQRCVPTVLASTIDKMDIKAPDGKTLNGTDVTVAEKAIEFLLSVNKVFLKIVDELRLTWKWLLVGFIVSMLLSVIYIVLARWITFPLVVISALGTLAILSYAAYYSLAKYKHLQEAGTSKDLTWSISMGADDFRQNQNCWLVLGIFLAITLLVLLLICVFLYSNARLACGLIAEASRAVCSMLSTLVFPMIPWILQAGWFLWFIAISLYLMSNGTKQYHVFYNDTNYNLTAGDLCDPDKFNQTYPDTDSLCVFARYVQNTQLFRMQMFHLIGWLWGANYIIAFTECSLAGAFASYYWAFIKPKDIPALPVFAAMYRAVFYHTGSLALGAAIIGTTQLIRITLEYVRRKLKENTDNKVADFVMKCLGCCFWCLEKCLRFINKNAYIMVAVAGKNFCTSAKKAVTLLISSIGSTIAINGVTSFILILGKMLITGGVGVASFYWFSKYNAHLTQKLDYSIVPIVICTCGAYLVTSLFFSVYDMGIDTIFLCYLHDVKVNDGSLDRPYYMSKALQDIMDKHNKDIVKKPEAVLLSGTMA